MCGRRFGKTTFAKEALCNVADVLGKALYWYTAPTRQMAKDLMWEDLKDSFKYYGWKFSKNESDLVIERTRTKVRIALKSAEKPDRLVGKGLNGNIFDEFGDILPEAYTRAIRPALSDKHGWCMFMGTPKGYNHFHDFWQNAKTKPGWASFRFGTKDSPFFQTPEGVAELAEARLDLDERTYRQEYEASFEAFAGRIIYAFDRALHHTDYEYDPNNKEIYVGQDFNRSPMSGVLFQKVGGRMIAFDEMSLMTSSTEEVCSVIKQRFPQSRIIFRPDATGRRRTSNSTRSDHEIIRSFGFIVDCADTNPTRVDRWQSTNRAFEREKVLINTQKCRKLTKELETISYKEGTCEADIKDALSGHLFDGFGYNIAREFPIIVPGTVRIQRL